MEGWFVPLISFVTVLEWGALWWIRRDGQRPVLTRDQVRARLSNLDLLVTIIAVGLFVSALQYPGVANGQDARIALNTVRVAMFLLGADLLWREGRAARGQARGR